MIRIISFLLMTLVWTVPLTVLAQPPVSPDSSLDQILKVLADAVAGGQWGVVVSAAIMLLVWVGTKTPVVAALVPVKARAWVAIGLGVLGAVVTNIMTGGDWLAAILSGLTTGAAAAGLWSAVGKHFLGEPQPDPDAEPAPDSQE